jgi:uncharacterized lipoprotein YajG
VSEAVRKAFLTEFTKNGHRAENSGRNIVVSGTIKNFWFDYYMGSFSDECMGIVDIELKIIDGETGKELFIQSYRDNYYEELGWLLNSKIERVMDTVLERLVFQVVRDPKLIIALKSVAGDAPPQ